MFDGCVDVTKVQYLWELLRIFFWPAGNSNDLIVLLLDRCLQWLQNKPGASKSDNTSQTLMNSLERIGALAKELEIKLEILMSKEEEVFVVIANWHNDSVLRRTWY
jgi:hypothetical protein